ncbi:heavy-metal-associated domain-containing protein [Segetibacter sp. 3557_3]|uniref:heavy-metal-associated domain-containing protein n=1 Tax=Segetibacter sp. 3557_3 TaxID=2547429 RepID=UPI0010584BA3|nr:heavy metal-associated domain-containing protein [Segetibacter sp. 3557_3]TDH26941.1 heavy-metal-associated domain-containing protein [Segetibacter sp. 3557_3]
MTHTYHITGMTCGSCVAKAKSQLLMLGDVSEADVQVTAPQATITMQKHIPVTTLQDALNKAGNYTITEADGGMHHTLRTEESGSSLETYKPVLLIGAYITGATLLIALARNGFDWHTWMQHFMAGFFLVFSFFKFLNLKGFAESYSSYDLIARRWSGWGYVYAFIELGLGIAFLVNFNPVITNAVTLVVMGISIVGVLQSVLNKRKIQCACLGAVFNLPMSTVTVIEDGLMILMSAIMLLRGV